MLRSPAAKQMLVDHFQAHIAAGAGAALGDDPIVPSSGLPLTPTGYPGVRNNFQNRMNTMGFPQTTRNVSMINGSGALAKFKDKNNNDINPGFDFIGTSSNQTNIDTGDVFAIINTRAKTFCEFMPNANVQETIVDVDIQAQIFFWITQDSFLATAKQSPESNGVDSSPGGLFDMSSLADSLPPGDPVLTNFLGAMKADKFSFIPAVSGMALNVGGVITANQPNYYFNINMGANDLPWDGTTTATTNTTPFKNWYLPPTNENHVTITQGNADFAWCEIVKPDVDFANIGANTFTACQGTNASFTFSNNVHGCNSITYTATGQPVGATVSFSPAIITADGNVTVSVSNLPAGTHTITITPVGFPTKAQTITVTIHPTNPNLAGTTQYKIDSGSFVTGNSVTVNQGANLELQIPSNLYVGTIEWFAATGISRGSLNPSIVNIQDASAEEGVWNARVTFANDCARLAPVMVPMTVIVDPPLSVNTNEFLGLNIFPNPSSGMVTISSNNNLTSAKMQLIDVGGRIISSKKPSALSPNSVQLDISELAQGSYLLVIENENYKSVKKIIKQ
jgi:hypothetical protein